MQIKYNMSDSSLSADIVSDVEPRLSVSVSRYKNWDYEKRGWRDVEINWSAYGNTKPENAEEYANLLHRAVRLANQFQLSVIKKYKVISYIKREGEGERDYISIVLATNEESVRVYFSSIPGVTIVKLEYLGAV